MQSFDRGYFDFNGVGEYVVFCGIVDGKINENLENCQPNLKKVLKCGDTTSVHYRFSHFIRDTPDDDLYNNYTATDPKGKAITCNRYSFSRKATIQVYDNSKAIKFPKRAPRNRMIRKRLKGAEFFKTPSTNMIDFQIRVKLKSGLVIRIKEDGLDVITLVPSNCLLAATNL